MALAAATVWEVRPTVGAATNGGGFVAGASGTDYSQQNSKNTVGNNISTTDAVGVGTTTLTSATASFTAAIVGNIIYLTGTGVTTGWYQVTAFTNATTITLDRNPGTFTGATMNIGGAVDHIATAYGAASLANTIYVKGSAGNEVVTSALALVGQNLDPPFNFIGYGSTRGDGVKATWTTSTNSINLIVPGASNPNAYQFQNFAFTTTAGTPGTCFNGGLSSYINGVRFYNCSFASFSSAIATFFSSGVHFQATGIWFDNCEISGSTGDGAAVGNNTYFFACYIHGNTGNGITANMNGGTDFAGEVIIDRTVLYNNGGKGAVCQGGTTVGAMFVPIITHCAFVSNTSDGLNSTLMSSGSGITVRNCIFDSNGGWGFNPRSSQWGPLSIFANAYFNNTSGTVSNSAFVGIGDVTLTGSPFNNPSGDDFALNSTAGAGAACKGAGYQGTLNGATSAIDIGPVQSAGGGSTTNLIVARNVTQVFSEEFA